MEAILVDTESNNAKLYIGLLGSTSTASSTYYWLQPKLTAPSKHITANQASGES